MACYNDQCGFHMEELEGKRMKVVKEDAAIIR